MPNMMRCIRCYGRKKVYKIMGGYSHVDSGGVKVDCPLCLGKGEMKTLEYAAKDAEEKIKSRKKKEIAIDSEENVIL